MSSLSRRDFAGVLAAGALSSSRVLGANNRIQAGFVGLGGRGTYLLDLVLKHIAANPDVEVMALCDVYQRRLDRAAGKAPGAKKYTYHQELLEHPGLDVVFVATPDHWHAPVTLAALDRGLDVYCEKPMTHTLEQAKEVAERVAAKKRVMQVGVQATSWDRWHKVREIVQQGVIGKVVSVQGTYSRNDPHGDWNWPIDAGAGPDAKGELHIDWKQWLGPAPKREFDADRFFRFRKYWDYSGGIATDLHYHIVAPFHIALENEHPARVSGMGGLWVYNDGREVPDTFLTAADYPGKYSLLVQSSQVNEIGPLTLLRGTQGTIHLGDEWEGPQGRNTDTARIIPDTPFKKEFVARHGSEEIVVEGVGNQGDLKHVDNFLECVRTRNQPNCHADLGYKVMTAIDLSVRSYREGKMYYFDAARGRATGGKA